MKAFRLTVATVVCAVPLLAAAQWQWLDKDGRKVFSDAPPPADVPDNRILRHPGLRAGAPAASPAPAAAETAAPAPKLNPVDKALEAKKKQAEEAEAARKKAEEQRFAQQKSENCDRARQAKATLDSGQRLVRTNAAGEREILDDKAREIEGKRIADIMARDCPKVQ